jgi:hypothetical protein
MSDTKDSDRLAIAIYDATIVDDRTFVPTADINKQLTAEGVDCEAAKHTSLSEVQSVSRSAERMHSPQGVLPRWVLHYPSTTQLARDETN